MLISICIPTYNRKNLLSRAILSALDQDYQNLEIVVCDNASTDGTEEIMLEMINKYPKVKYFRNEQNAGMVANWKLCLERAKGDYYMILDDDNYLIYNSYITDAAEGIKKHSNINLVFGDFLIRFKSKDSLQHYELPAYSTGLDVYIEYFNKKKVPEIFFVILNRKVALKYSFYEEDIVTHDVQSFLASMLTGNVYYIKRVTGIYDLTGGDNLVYNLEGYWKDYINYQEKVIDIAKSIHIDKDIYQVPFKRQISRTYVSIVNNKNPVDVAWYKAKIKSLYGITFLMYLGGYTKLRNIYKKLF